MLKRYTADALLLCVTFIWGTTFVLVQDAIQVLPVFLFLSLRFFTGGVLLILPALSAQKLRAELKQPVLWLRGAILGFWLFAGYALQTLGLLYTTPAKSGFITGLCVVLVPIFSLFLLKKKTEKKAWIGVAVATCGLFLLSHSRSGNVNIGDILTLFCAISFAIQIVLVGKYAPSHHPLPLAAVQILSVGVFSIFVTIITGVQTEKYQGAFHDSTVLWSLGICTLLATVLAYVAQTAFQKFTTPTRTALIFATEPVFAALASYWWTKDRLTALSFIGCALILGGMLIAELGLGNQVKKHNKKRKDVSTMV